jgi:O-ureido-D-serine cyclo-ligase
MPRPDADLPILVRAFAERGACAEIVPWEDAGVAWQDFDAALVRSTWNYVGRYREFHAWIDRVAAATRLLNPRGAMLWNLHKRYLAELAGAGIDVVPTEVVLHGVDPDWEALFARFGDLVVKPAVSAGSFATIRVRRGDVAAARAHRMAHFERDLLVQPLLASVVAHGETNLVHFGGRFSHAIHKGARWDGDAEQSRGVVQPETDELALASRVLAHVDAHGRRSEGHDANAHGAHVHGAHGAHVHGAHGHGWGGAPLAYARVDVARGADGRPLLMELEIVEPSLFLDRAPEQAALLVEAVLA